MPSTVEAVDVDRVGASGSSPAPAPVRRPRAPTPCGTTGSGQSSACRSPAEPRRRSTTHPSPVTVARAHGRSSSRSTVTSASRSGRGATPMPGPSGARIRPSAPSSIGSVRSSSKYHGSGPRSVWSRPSAAPAAERGRPADAVSSIPPRNGRPCATRSGRRRTRRRPPTGRRSSPSATRRRAGLTFTSAAAPRAHAVATSPGPGDRLVEGHRHRELRAPARPCRPGRRPAAAARRRPGARSGSSSAAREPLGQADRARSCPRNEPLASTATGEPGTAAAPPADRLEVPDGRTFTFTADGAGVAGPRPTRRSTSPSIVDAEHRGPRQAGDRRPAPHGIGQRPAGRAGGAASSRASASAADAERVADHDARRGRPRQQRPARARRAASPRRRRCTRRCRSARSRRAALAPALHAVGVDRPAPAPPRGSSSIPWADAQRPTQRQPHPHQLDRVEPSATGRSHRDAGGRSRGGWRRRRGRAPTARAPDRPPRSPSSGGGARRGGAAAASTSRAGSGRACGVAPAAGGHDVLPRCARRPRLRGTTWSMLSARLPQYWQRAAVAQEHPAAAEGGPALERHPHEVSAAGPRDGTGTRQLLGVQRLAGLVDHVGLVARARARRRGGSDTTQSGS